MQNYIISRRNKNSNNTYTLRSKFINFLIICMSNDFNGASYRTFNLQVTPIMRLARSFKYGGVFFSDTNSMSYILAEIKLEDVYVSLYKWNHSLLRES